MRQTTRHGAEPRDAGCLSRRSPFLCRPVALRPSRLHCQLRIFCGERTGKQRAAASADSVASFNMHKDDVDLFMQQPWVITGSDGSNGHPRQYATFPQKYAQYVKLDHVITVGDFIRRSTGLSADILGLEETGYLRDGYFADIVVLDPDRFAPRADYVHPRVLSSGVEQLLVNGRQVIADGRLTGLAPGGVRSHPATPGTCP